MSYPVSAEDLMNQYGYLLQDKALNNIANWIMPNDDEELDIGKYLEDATAEENIESFAKVAIPAIKNMKHLGTAD